MGSNQAKLFVLHPLLKGNHIFCHFPYFFYTSAALDIKSVENILCLCADCFLVGNLIGNGPHLFPVKLLGIKVHSSVKIGLVDIKVHHARIRSSHLSDVGVAESSSYLSRTAPLLDFFLYAGVAAFNNSRNHSMTLSVPFKVSHHLAHSAAGIAFAKP